jgi:DNA mismatch endonuclease, patch repair protein
LPSKGWAGYQRGGSWWEEKLRVARAFEKEGRRRHFPGPLSAVVRSNMQAMPTRNSSPELALRRILHARGLRYRLHQRSLPGSPDITFGPAKVAVFVDGCFWHACPAHGTVPKNNRAWWRRKFAENRRRDRQKDQQLDAIGWLPIHVWEHEDMMVSAGRIARVVKMRRGTLGRV